MLEGFDTSTGIILDPENRWVKLSNCIPWDELAESYYKMLSPPLGRPAKDARRLVQLSSNISYRFWMKRQLNKSGRIPICNIL